MLTTLLPAALFALNRYAVDATSGAQVVPSVLPSTSIVWSRSPQPCGSSSTTRSTGAASASCSVSTPVAFAARPVGGLVAVVGVAGREPGQRVVGRGGGRQR